MIEFNEYHPHHLDATFVPLKPYLIMCNPERKLLPEYECIFRNANWKIIYPPKSTNSYTLLCSRWLSMNILSIDTKKVIVEASEHTMINFLNENGFTVIPVKFNHVYWFGGGLHCNTLDLYREGSSMDNYNFSDFYDTDTILY
jgi:glycine amidinotransferase